MKCREWDDHWTINMTTEGIGLMDKMNIRMTCKSVKFLCRIFKIPYDPKWTYYYQANQLCIHKKQ